MDALNLAVFTFVLCIGQGVTQIHIGPINDQVYLTCPFCDGKAHPFPACLNAMSEPCHSEEVCSIIYTGDQPTYKCQKSGECGRPTDHPTGICLAGVEVHPGQCQVCCGTTVCVQDMNRLITQQFSQRLFCPGSCVETNLAACVQDGTYCSEGQFCEVIFGDHLSVQGQCRDNHEMPKCLEEQSRHPCVITEHAHKCMWDCCSDTACLTKHFSPYIVVNTISQTSQPQMTLEPSLPPTLPPTQPLPTGPTVKPLTCYECDGGFCHHNERNVTCLGGFCMMTVEEDTGGSRFVSKRCADLTECYNAWHDGWMNNTLCSSYLLNPTKLSGHDMTCKFCCTGGDHCNNQIDIQNVLKF